MTKRFRLAALLATGGIAACGGDASFVVAANLAQLDVQRGDVVLLKTSSGTNSLGQPLPTDVPQDELAAVGPDGSVRALTLRDTAGATREVGSMGYVDLDAELGLFVFDGISYALRKADGTLVRLGHRPRFASGDNVYPNVAAGRSNVYVEGGLPGVVANVLLSYPRATLLSANAGATLAPTEVFRASFTLDTGAVDDVAGVVYANGRGVVTLAGATVEASTDEYFLGTDAVYAPSDASYDQCAGGPTLSGTLAVVTATPTAVSKDPLFLVRPSTDPSCNPQTDGVTTAFLMNPSRRFFGWAPDDFARAGSASYAYELVGDQVVAHPNLAADLQASFPGGLSDGTSGLDFDCVTDTCMIAVLHPQNVLAAFGTDDADGLLIKDSSPAVDVAQMRAVPFAGDYVLVGDAALARVAASGAGLAYTPTVTINGDFAWAVVR